MGLGGFHGTHQIYRGHKPSETPNGSTVQWKDREEHVQKFFDHMLLHGKL